MIVHFPANYLSPRKGVKWKNAYVGGTFDLLHTGHLALFWRARQLADRVTVSVNTDEFAAAYKREPFMPLRERLAVLREIRSVDRVIVNTGNEDSRPSILFADADCVIHGSDWTGVNLMKQMGLTEAWLREHKIDLITVPYTDGVSTTDLLSARDIKFHARAFEMATEPLR